MTEARTIDLPHFNTRVEFLPTYEKETLEDLARRLTTDEELSQRMRAAPLAELENVGVRIYKTGPITDQELLQALGHQGPETECLPLVVVVVAIAVTQAPHD